MKKSPQSRTEPEAARRHVLVTGGAGFIGSHLVERLLADGQSVVVIDDCSTGTWENLRPVARHRRLRTIEATVSECRELGKVVRGAASVYHLAAAVGVELVLRSPVEAVRRNLRDTETVLEVAAAHGVPVLLTSSSEVYGKSDRAAFGEEDDLIIGPPHLTRWSYACSKLMDEFVALAYARERRLPVVIARLFNTVGPRQTGRYGMVLPRFIAAARAGEPLRVFGDGSQRRCFCWVGDTVEALVRLQKTTAGRGQVFNVGSDEEVSIRSLARRVIQLLNSRSRIEFVPYERAYGEGFADLRRRKPKLDRLRQVTGFRPKTSLDEIIRRTAR